MYFSTATHVLLRAVTAGAAMLAAAACSRADRGGTSGDTTQVSSSMPADSNVSGYRAMPPHTSGDTGSSTAGSASARPSSPPVTSSSARVRTATGRSTADSVVVGDSSNIGKSGERLEPTAASGQANRDTQATQRESDRIRPPEDSSETVGTVTSDSSAAAAPSGDSTGGAPEMARDTSSSLAQADTAAPDSSVVQAQVDTTQETEMAQQAPVDTAAPVQVQMDSARMDADTAAVQAQADTSTTAQPSEAAPQSVRIRPPEDSTELQGNVTAKNSQTEAVAPSDTASTAAAAAGAGAQSNGMATGADAVALTTREGRRCSVVSDDADRRDLASSPATLNPCGTGTMTMPRVQVEEK